MDYHKVIKYPGESVLFVGDHNMLPLTGYSVQKSCGMNNADIWGLFVLLLRYIQLNFMQKSHCL